MELAAKAYNAALTPLKLTVKGIAGARFDGKFLMKRTKQTVLNQVMLHPDNKHSENTCQINSL